MTKLNAIVVFFFILASVNCFHLESNFNKPSSVFKSDTSKNDLVVIGDKEYYISLLVEVTWGEALRICEGKNMRLVSLQTQEKYEQIYNFLLTNTTDQGYYWTSGVRVGETLVWSATGQEATYINWYSNQPNYEGHDCLLMSVHQMDGMHDYFCDDQPKRFICEHPFM